jgi:MFS family permease
MAMHKALPTSGRSLGRAYWRLWASSGLSNLADGVFKVALPLAAIQFTRSPTLIAGLTFAVTIPWLIFALPAGALADRLDRRLLMLSANAVRATLLGAVALAILLDVDMIWMLYFVAFCVGIAETMYDTSAQSIVPRIVRRDQLSRANGRLYAVELTANEFVGPPLAGLLTAAGAAIAFAVPASLWVVGVVALLLVPGRFRVERDVPAPDGGVPMRTTIRADIAEGLRFLWQHRLLRTFALMVGATNFAGNAVMAILVLYTVGGASAMQLSGQAFGLLLSTIAAGSLLGSLVAEWFERKLGRGLTLGLSFATRIAFLGVPALTANPYVIGAAFFLGGAGTIAANVVMVSLRQRITPDRLLGRINSGYRLIAWGAIPLGAVTGGLLTQWFGIRSVFVVMAVVSLLVLAGLAVATNERMAAAERDADLS